MMREVIEWARSLEMRGKTWLWGGGGEGGGGWRRGGGREGREGQGEVREDKGKEEKEEKETRRVKIKRVNHGRSACKWCLWVIGDRQGRCACHWKFTHLKYPHKSMCWACWAGLFRNQEVGRITDILWRKWSTEGFCDGADISEVKMSMLLLCFRWEDGGNKRNKWVRIREKNWIRVKRGTDVPKKVILEGKLR